MASGMDQIERVKDGNTIEIASPSARMSEKRRRDEVDERPEAEIALNVSTTKKRPRTSESAQFEEDLGHPYEVEPTDEPHKHPEVQAAGQGADVATLQQRISDLEAIIPTLEAQLEARNAHALATEDELETLKLTFTSDLSRIEENVSCGVCCNKLWYPYLLRDCGHSFCEDCLFSWFSQSQPTSTCPECRTAVRGVPTEIILVKDLVQNVSDAQVKLGVQAEPRPERTPQARAKIEAMFHHPERRREMEERREPVSRFTRPAPVIRVPANLGSGAGLLHAEARQRAAHGATHRSGDDLDDEQRRITSQAQEAASLRRLAEEAERDARQLREQTERNAQELREQTADLAQRQQQLQQGQQAEPLLQREANGTTQGRGENARRQTPQSRHLRMLERYREFDAYIATQTRRQQQTRAPDQQPQNASDPAEDVNRRIDDLDRRDREFLDNYFNYTNYLHHRIGRENSEQAEGSGSDHYSQDTAIEHLETMHGFEYERQNEVRHLTSELKMERESLLDMAQG